MFGTFPGRPKIFSLIFYASFLSNFSKLFCKDFRRDLIFFGWFIFFGDIGNFYLELGIGACFKFKLGGKRSFLQFFYLLY
jgi:hypothetical protein